MFSTIDSVNVSALQLITGMAVIAMTTTGCTGTVTVAGNVASMVVVLVLLWSTITMERR